MEASPSQAVRSRTWSRSHRRVAGLGSVLALWGVLLAPSAAATANAAEPVAPAQQAENCSDDGVTTTCTYVAIGDEQHLGVPGDPGVAVTLHVEATGAPGAAGEAPSPAGGRGVVVTADLVVHGTQTIFIEVGGPPHTAPTCAPGVACVGGFNGGGSSSDGGGGGGASDVRTLTSTAPGSLDSRVLVAAGGGGSGQGGACDQTGEDLIGGAGGAAGVAGGAGESCGGNRGGTGGEAGTQNAGGAGGIDAGQPGAFGQGGNGGLDTGGSGGGGRYGGGGGGNFFQAAFDLDNTAAGGGGGGSNLVPGGGSSAIDTTGVPKVTISYSSDLGAQPDPCQVPRAGAIVGTDGNDMLLGTRGADLIVAKAGNDLVLGRGSNDQICGGPGDDRIVTGSGNDLVLAGPGGDVVATGSGNDHLALAQGNDLGLTGLGDDMLLGGFGRDRLFGGPGGDTLAGGPASDLVNGGLGDDVLIGDLAGPTPTWLPPTVDAKANRDRCIGAAGTDAAFLCERTVGVEASS
jgi:RTX calcium-binding nonapeptide repeat (4 copies)/Glycine rich protein